MKKRAAFSPVGALPEYYSLQNANIDWQIFGVLTFTEDLPEWKRRIKVSILIRKLAKLTHTYVSRLLWVLKQEQGTGGVIHFHLLVAGIRQPGISEKTLRKLRDIWLRYGGGFSRLKPYDPALNGLGYVLKSSGEKSGNMHEQSVMFDEACKITLSKSLMKFLRRNS